jgi:hypothetical protein
VPLPAATAFIEIDQQSQLAASIGDTTKVSLAPLDGTPTISDEVVGGEEGEGPVGDDTVLADEAVLAVNEVEEVLRDAFEEADQLASITNDQGATPVGDDPTLVSPGSSLDCVGIRWYPRLRPERHNPRSSCRRGAGSPRTSNQGNSHLYSKPPGLSDSS